MQSKTCKVEMRYHRRCHIISSFVSLFSIFSSGNTASAFTSSSQTSGKVQPFVCPESEKLGTQRNVPSQIRHVSAAAVIGASLFFGAQFAMANEIGVEVEAPTFGTGETVEVGQIIRCSCYVSLHIYSRGLFSISSPSLL